MNRNERIRQKCNEIDNTLARKTRWVEVSVSPGYSCTAPFVTIDPRTLDVLRGLLESIRSEVEMKRKRGAR